LFFDLKKKKKQKGGRKKKVMIEKDWIVRPQGYTRAAQSPLCIYRVYIGHIFIYFINREKERRR